METVGRYDGAIIEQVTIALKSAKNKPNNPYSLDKAISAVQ